MYSERCLTDTQALGAQHYSRHPCWKKELLWIKCLLKVCMLKWRLMTGLISTGEKVRIDELGESRRRRQCSAVTEHRNASGRGGLVADPGVGPESLHFKRVSGCWAGGMLPEW